MKHHGQMVSLMTSMAIDRGTVVVVALLVEAEADILLAMTGGYSAAARATKARRSMYVAMDSDRPA